MRGKVENIRQQTKRVPQRLRVVPWPGSTPGGRQISEWPVEDENEKGMLIKGMLADLAVLSQDIFTIPNQQLPATTSVLTMIDGKILYQDRN